MNTHLLLSHNPKFATALQVLVQIHDLLSFIVIICIRVFSDDQLCDDGLGTLCFGGCHCPPTLDY
jgi:hypothetical protein